MTEHEPSHDDYWNHDEQIGAVTLWRAQTYALRLKAHLADELYHHRPSEEIIPLSQPRGVRRYVQAKPYVLVPDMTMTIGLYPTADARGAVGEVSSSAWEGMRHEEIGHAQAWYYPADRTIVLWEAYLLPHARGPKPAEDPNTMALWEGFEAFLTRRFPSARQIVTTYDDPEYERDAYQAMLRGLGYQSLNPAAFAKTLRADL